MTALLCRGTPRHGASGDLSRVVGHARKRAIMLPTQRASCIIALRAHSTARSPCDRMTCLPVMCAKPRGAVQARISAAFCAVRCSMVGARCTVGQMLGAKGAGHPLCAGAAVAPCAAMPQHERGCVAFSAPINSQAKRASKVAGQPCRAAAAAGDYGAEACIHHALGKD